MTYYYDVLVASQQYHKPEPLTYASAKILTSGQVVVVELKTHRCVGVILRKSSKPHFNVKQISRIVSESPIPQELLKLHQWLTAYYPAPSGTITQLFAPTSLIPASKASPPKADAVPPPSRAVAPDQQLPIATPEQQAALDIINQSDAPVLLHGDTGTGKTFIYIHLTLACLSKGKSALILTPEISLTPQLIQSFIRHVKADNVVVVHSTLSATERRRAWLAIAESTRPMVVIGARSALFSPLSDIGLIVIDEAHDDAFKQEQMPRYQTTRAAALLARLHRATLVLGSATPPVNDYYAFVQKKLPIVRMTAQAMGTIQPLGTHIIDLKNTQNFTKSRWLSDVLLTSIGDALRDKKQTLLFLNRRGSARSIVCKECGWQSLCPRCDLPLTYHHDIHAVQCHTCGYKNNVMSACPLCNSTQILFKSIGTKSVLEEISRLFPNAKIARFDGDTPRQERLEQQYSAIHEGKVDILVGTQMVTKGLDLPNLSVVGVIIADTSLYFPDYTAEERTFQMIAQVSGRVGRGHGSGTVVVQTYDPTLPAITAALERNYTAFYEQQIAERRQLGFPPFCYAVKLWATKKTRGPAEKVITQLSNDIRANHPSVTIIGPSPAFTEKSASGYTWQLIVTSPTRTVLTDIIKNLTSHINYDIDPNTLL